MKYEAVIGLEIHVQLKTATKMFCGCRNEYGAESNTHLCPVCLGLPGALPVPNEEAIIQTILTGLMLGCEIAPVCKFDRKNYFYPDMPKNYQISQYDMPLCRGGGVKLNKYAFPKEVQKDPIALAGKTVRLVRIHLEEDVAKSTHLEDSTTIDFNRAGIPLMEIVTEADIRGPEEAFAFLTTFKQILTYGGVSDADMEKGQLRCDVNISVRPEGQEVFGTKCEIKNMNSISGVRRALEYEIARQIEVISQGGCIVQETRRWNDMSGRTFTMRTKEQAHDYRYFPCPDLLPIRTDQGLRQKAEARIPELPAQKKARFEKDYHLSDYQAEVLAADKGLSDYFEAAAAHTKHASAVANWLINDFLATEPDTTHLELPAVFFAELAELTQSGTINSKQAKEVFQAMLAENKSPKALVKELGLEQISDTSALEALCDAAIAAKPDSVQAYRSGRLNAINALKGHVMKASGGKANPQIVDQILQRKLS